MATQPKKSKNSNTGKHRPGNPALRDGAPTVASLDEVRADRAFARVVPALARWAAQQDGPGENVKNLLERLQRFFSLYADFATELDLTALEPAAVADLLRSADDFSPEAGVAFGETLHTYVHFLIDTDAWTGGPAALDDIHRLAERGPDDAPQDVLPDVVVPELTDEQARAGVEALPFWQRARALLGWIGDGKEVTTTGVLRLKDIQPAASCVGVEAAGSRRMGADGKDPSGLRTVNSMLDVPGLMDYWVALEAVGLIAVSATRVRPTMDTIAALADPHGANPSLPVRLARVLAAYFYLEIVMGESGSVFHAEFQPLAMALFLAAASDSPPQTDDVFASLAGEPMGELWSTLLRGELESWAEDGLVSVGERIVIPDVLRQAMADVVDLATSTAAGRDRRAPSQATYQLKIQLDGIRPPIWRRIEVPAELRLDELHEIIQSSFNWEDYHLHRFRHTEWGGTTYGPFDPDEDHWGEPPVDETGVALTEVLPLEKSKLKYVYDFGDNWAHTITLEKVLPAAPAGELPRCTGGRGMAPQEDSGGPWGWMDIVGAANDPRHQEHGHYRDWVGLNEGGELDLAAFDFRAVDQELEAFRY
ncbi:plasmid pRiA4b ORF-3 family protein [Pseudarthrobacter sp. P1]|uniref:plasmid pRiA4b ORF-3 family protein n=1 Tax=Pseudarthrobacter sp. P1 TaxID=3418418 RepID=UPI003CF51C1A